MEPEAILSLTKDITGRKRSPSNYSTISFYPPHALLPKLVDQDPNRSITEWSQVNAILRSTQNLPIALYTHVGYCNAGCTYCTIPRTRGRIDSIQESMEPYLQGSITDFRLWAEVFPGQNVVAIYTGGGTPSLMSSSQLEQYYEDMITILNIDTDRTEITFEASPDTITEKHLIILKSLGIKRMSMGVQSFDDTVLKGIGRGTLNNKGLLRTIAMCLRYIDNLDIDIMIALPYQDISSLEKTLKVAVKSGVASISLYQLRMGGSNAPVRRLYNGDHKLFPTAEEAFNMHLYARDLLRELSFHEINDNFFIVPGRGGNRYAKHVWNNGTLVGVGGSFNYNYIHPDEGDPMAYISSSSEGDANSYRGRDSLKPYGIVLTKDDIMRRTVIMGLKTSGRDNPDGGINITAFYNEFGIGICQVFGKEIGTLVNAKFLEIQNGYLRFTRIGLGIYPEALTMFYPQYYRDLLGESTTGRGTYEGGAAGSDQI